MKHRITTIVLVFGLLVLALANFSKVKNVFFPPSNTPIFFVDVWLKEGSDIHTTKKYVQGLEADIATNEHVKSVTSTIGQGGVRFVLPYAVEKAYPAYAQLMVKMDSLESILAYLPKLDEHLKADYPDAFFRVKLMENGPSPAAKIEARFMGEDPRVLRNIASQAMDILHAEPTAVNIRHDWRNQVLVSRPKLVESRARESGITKSGLDLALLANFEGMIVGVYREGSDVLPVVLRSQDKMRLNIDSINSLSVWSPERGNYIPATQVISDIETEWEDPLVMRRDRKRTLSVLADPDMFSDETADSVFRKIKADIEAIPLPPGYELEWGGEYEASRDAQLNIFASLPVGYLFMFLITVFLFNSVRKPLSIWFNIPLVMIGVTTGLLVLDAPFSFMALLGLLSLSGMVIKNGIVLVDQISAELDEGKDPYNAVFHASVSRVRPVSMAAITTMLGMIPLFFDAFFESMAVTIVFGLGFATVLTLIVLPVTYCLLFKIKQHD
jgi:multidrug efflux pump subunit AcrB